MISIASLISRMLDDSYRPGETKITGVYESGKTVSAEAHEEARLLDNKELLPELYAFLNTESDNDKRSQGYFIIGNIAKNSGDIDATKYLVEALIKEKDKNNLVTILSLLPALYKPLSINLSPIYKLTASRNPLVRGLSFEALTNTENKVEDFLIDQLKSTYNKDDIQSILYAIEKVGTKKSLPVVEPHLKSRSSETKSTALSVVALIMIREGFSDADIIKKLKLPTNSILIKTLRERQSLLTTPG